MEKKEVKKEHKNPQKKKDEIQEFRITDFI